MEYPDNWPYPHNGFLVGTPGKENATRIPADLVYTYLIQKIETQINEWKDHYYDYVE